MRIVYKQHILSDPSLQKHPKAQPFRKKGFPLFDDIGNLIDGTRATGEFAFRAGQSRQTPGPSYTRHSSPATPPGDDYDARIDPELLDISKDTSLTRNANNSRTRFEWENDKYSDDEEPIQVRNSVIFAQLF